MTTLIILGIIVPVLLLGALCVWLAVRLQRAERELDVWRAVTMRKRSWWDNGLHEEWIREEKSVRPDKLSHRREPCPIVDDAK